MLNRAGNEDRVFSNHVRGRAKAIELTRRTVDQNLYLGTLPTMANLRAGWYLNVVNSFGESPVAGTEIAALEPTSQTEADQQLAYGVNAGLYPVGAARPRGACHEARPGRALKILLPGRAADPSSRPLDRDGHAAALRSQLRRGAGLHGKGPGAVESVAGPEQEALARPRRQHRSDARLRDLDQ